MPMAATQGMRHNVIQRIHHRNISSLQSVIKFAIYSSVVPTVIREKSKPETTMIVELNEKKIGGTELKMIMN